MSDDIDIDLDDDMMGGFDDFDSFDNPNQDEGSRKPIVNIGAGALDRLTSTDTAVSLSRTIAKNALPPGFTVAMNRSDDLASGISDIYNDAAKELKGPIKDLKKLVNGSIESAKWLPEDVRRKIADMTASTEDTYSPTVDPRQLEMQEASNRIFASMAQQSAEDSALNAQVEQKKTEAQLKGTDAIVAELRKLTGYQKAVESEYQKKDLELQFRQYYALKDLVENSRATGTDLMSYLKAIKINTGLPDIQKTKLSEEYQQGLVDNMIGRHGETFGEYASAFGGRVKDRIKEKVSGAIGDFAGMLDMVNTLQDASEQISELSDTEKEEMVGGEIAGMGIPFLGEEASKRLGKLLLKNPKLVEKSNNLIYISENYPQLLRGWLSSKAEDSFIAEQLLELTPAFGGSSVSVTNSLMSNGHQQGTYTNTTDNSINVVIPGYLARILQATQQTAEGVNPGGSPDLLSYSVQSRDFETSKTSLRRTRSNLTDSGSTKQAAFDSIFESIDPKGELSKGQRERVASFLLDQAASGERAFNVSDLASNPNAEIASIFSDVNSKPSLEISEINKNLSRDYSRLSEGFKENSETVNRMFNTGQRDTLTSLGLLEVDGRGNYSFDNDNLRKLILSDLDLNKKYVNADGSSTGNRVLSDAEIKAAEEKELEEAKKKKRKDKNGSLKDEVKSTISNTYNQAKQTVSKLSGQAYDHLPAEFREDIDFVRKEAEAKLNDIKAAVDEEAAKRIDQLKGTNAYRSVNDTVNALKESEQYRAFTDVGSSVTRTVKDAYDEFNPDDYSFNRIKEGWQNLDMSYSANKQRGRDALKKANGLKRDYQVRGLNRTSPLGKLDQLPYAKKSRLSKLLDDAVNHSSVEEVTKLLNDGLEFSKEQAASLYGQASAKVSNAKRGYDIRSLDRHSPIGKPTELQYGKTVGHIDGIKDSVRDSLGDFAGSASNKIPPELREKYAELKGRLPSRDEMYSSYSQAKDFMSSPTLTMDMQEAVRTLSERASGKAKSAMGSLPTSVEDARNMANGFGVNALSAVTGSSNSLSVKALKALRDRRKAGDFSGSPLTMQNDYLDPKLLGLVGDNAPMLNRTPDTRSANRELFDTLKDEVAETLKSAVEQGIGTTDFGIVSEKLDTFLNDAKADLMLNLEGLRDKDFVSRFKAISGEFRKDESILDGDQPTGKTYTPPQAKVDVSERLEDTEDKVDKSFLSSNDLLALANAVKTAGSDIVDKFKLGFRFDQDDTLNGLPVHLTNESTREDISLASLIDVNVEGFQKTLEAIEAMHLTLSTASLASDTVDPTAKGILADAAGGLLSRVGGGVKGMMTSYFNGASKLTGAMLGGLGSAGGKVAGGFGAGLSTVFRSGQSDIFVEGSVKPALLAKNLIAGDYTDVESGKVVRSVDDVTGRVIDKDGNTVITAEEYAKGLYALDTGGFGSALKLVSSPFRLAFKAQANLINAVLSVPKKILSTISGIWNKPYDVYVGGEDRPRLHAFVFKNGGYRSNNTGKLLEHPDDIDGEVADLNGNVIVSNDDLEKGLFTRGGRKVGTSKLFHHLKNFVTGTAGLMWRSAKASVNMGLGVAKFGVNTVGSVGGSVLDAGLRALNLKDSSTVSGEALGGNDTLKLIHKHMTTKWPLEKDYDSPEMDPLEERLADAQDEMVDAIREAVSDKEPEEPKERKVRKLFSSSSDSDGDGDRDGGWRDIFSRRGKKDKDGNPITKDGKEEKGGLLSLLGSIFGVLAPVGGLLAKGFAGLMGLLGFKKAGDFMAGGDIPDIDGPDREGRDRDRRDRNSRDRNRPGRNRRGKIGRWAGKLWEGTKSVGSKLATGAKSLVNGRTASLGLKTGAKWLGKKALMGLAGAGAVAAGILSAPVVVAAGIAYGAYEVYNLVSWMGKRADMEELEKLRFMQYGLSGDDYDFVSAIRELESNLEDEVTRSNTPEITVPVSEVIDDHAEYFDFDMDDPQAVAEFGYWYTRRFSPVFLVHSMAAYKVDKGIDITDVDDEMDGKTNKVNFVKDVTRNAKFLDEVNVYQVVNKPGPDFTVASNRKEVFAYAESLIGNMGTTKDVKEFKSPPKTVVEAAGKKPEDVPSPVEVIETKHPDKVKEVRTLKQRRMDKKIEALRERRALGLTANGKTISVPVKEAGEVLSTKGGVVEKVGDSDQYGKYVVVKNDDGTKTIYHNMGDSAIGLKVSDVIDAGSVVGYGSDDGFFKRTDQGKASTSVAKAPVVEMKGSGDQEQRYTATSSQPKRVEVRPQEAPTVDIQLAAKYNEAQAKRDRLLNESFSNKLRASNTVKSTDYESLALAKDQRNAMISNQGIIIEELRNIVTGVTGLSLSDVATKSPPPPKPSLNQVKVPVPFSKKSQV